MHCLYVHVLYEKFLIKNASYFLTLELFGTENFVPNHQSFEDKNVSCAYSESLNATSLNKIYYPKRKSNRI